MDILQKNIKTLRNQKGFTQQQFADILKIKRSSIGAYEEGRAKPNLDVQKNIAKLFGISLDTLLTKDLTAFFHQHLKNSSQEKTKTGVFLSDPRVLAITVDREGKENIELVSHKAAAGYLNGYADPEFMESLPKFQLPWLKGGTFRAFEINGDSMLPLQPGSIVLGEYISEKHEIKDGHTYVVLTKADGVVYKRVFNSENNLVLRSDNPSYPPLEVSENDILEMWKAKLFITKPGVEQQLSLENISQMVMKLQHEVMQLKEQ